MDFQKKISIREIDEVMLRQMALPETEDHLKFYFKMLNWLLFLTLAFAVATCGFFLAKTELILSLYLGIATTAFTIVLAWNVAWAQDELRKVIDGLVFLGEDVKKWRYIYVEGDSVVLSNKRPFGFYFRTNTLPTFPLEE